MFLAHALSGVASDFAVGTHCRTAERPMATKDKAACVGIALFANIRNTRTNNHNKTNTATSLGY